MICASTKKKCLVVCVIALSLVIYSFNLFTTGTEASPLSINECVPLENWLKFTKYTTFADTVLTIFIPFITISIVNTVIAYKLTKSSEFRIFRLFSKSASCTMPANGKNLHLTIKNSPHVKFYNSTHEANQTMDIDLCGEKNSQNDVRLVKSKKKELNDFLKSDQANEELKNRFTSTTVAKRKKKYSRATLVLLSISTSFLILNFPIALCKIIFTFGSKIESAYEPPEQIVRTHNIENTIVHEILDEEELNRTLVSSALFNASYTSFASDIDPLAHLLDKITTNLHYLNFVLNFFLYSLNGAKFRKSVLRLFKLK